MWPRQDFFFERGEFSSPSPSRAVGFCFCRLALVRFSTCISRWPWNCCGEQGNEATLLKLTLTIAIVWLPCPDMFTCDIHGASSGHVHHTWYRRWHLLQQYQGTVNVTQVGFFLRMGQSSSTSQIRAAGSWFCRLGLMWIRPALQGNREMASDSEATRELS